MPDILILLKRLFFWKTIIIVDIYVDDFKNKRL